MKTRVNEFRLQVSGLFGRNRKNKFETFLLIELPIEQSIDEAQIKGLAQLKMAEIKLKSGKVKVTKTPVTIEKTEFFVSRSHEISLLAENTFLDMGSI